MAEWFYQKDGQQLGPVSSRELQRLVQAGELQPQDLVWKDGMEAWKPSREIPGLRPREVAECPIFDESVTPRPKLGSLGQIVVGLGHYFGFVLALATALLISWPLPFVYAGYLYVMPATAGIVVLICGFEPTNRLLHRWRLLQETRTFGAALLQGLRVGAMTAIVSLIGGLLH